MNFQEIKDRVLTDRMFKGIVIGVLSSLAVSIIILLAVIVFRPSPGQVPVAGQDAEDGDVRPRPQSGDGEEDGTAESSKDGIYEYGVPLSKYRKVEGNIRRGEFFSTLMTR